jgi:hypothetical protein
MKTPRSASPKRRPHGRPHLVTYPSHEWSPEHDQTNSLRSSIDSLYELPARQVRVKHQFTAEAKAALLQALHQHSWTTAREAYGWVWNVLGLRINYLTVWRFFTAQGLFVGDTPRARRLIARPAPNDVPPPPP